MDNNRLKEIKARCEAATPGPWIVADGKSFGVQGNGKNIASCFRRVNEEFIAYARQDIPDLLAYIDQLKKVRKASWCIDSTSRVIGIDEIGNLKWATRDFYRCSSCHTGTVVKSRYCAYCGSRMEIA